MTDKQIIIDGVDVSGCKYYLFREKQPKGERCCGMGLVDCNNNDCLYKKYKRKEQECKELEKLCNGLDSKIDNYTNLIALKNQQLDQLKAEIKSKTEYIQEQRDIINQYSKEIEMYKKCQGKRASKREEELKAENEKLDTENKRLVAELANPVFDSFEELDKLKQTLAEIKEIAEENDELLLGYHKEWANNKIILGKISEVEDEAT